MGDKRNCIIPQPSTTLIIGPTGSGKTSCLQPLLWSQRESLQMCKRIVIVGSQITSYDNIQHYKPEFFKQLCPNAEKAVTISTSMLTPVTIESICKLIDYDQASYLSTKMFDEEFVETRVLPILSTNDNETIEGLTGRTISPLEEEEKFGMVNNADTGTEVYRVSDYLKAHDRPIITTATIDGAKDTNKRALSLIIFDDLALPQTSRLLKRAKASTSIGSTLYGTDYQALSQFFSAMVHHANLAVFFLRTHLRGDYQTLLLDQCQCIVTPIHRAVLYIQISPFFTAGTKVSGREASHMRSQYNTIVDKIRDRSRQSLKKKPVAIFWTKQMWDAINTSDAEMIPNPCVVIQ